MTYEFFEVSNVVLNDKNLSFTAKGLYGLIASFETFPTNEQLIKLGPHGKTKLRSTLAELCRAGYITRKRGMVNGRPGIVREIVRDPKAAIAECYGAKSISKEMREFVHARDNHKCVYCESEFSLTLDHVIPHALGGSNAPENLVTACKACNSKKGIKSQSEFQGGAS